MNDRDREVIGLVVVVNGSRGPKLHYRNPKFRSSSFYNRNENTVDETQLPEMNIQHLNSKDSMPSFKDLSTINDAILEDICSLKHSRSDRRFHLEIHEIAFLGYPVRWDGTMLNIIFVTRANVLTSLSNQLFELSQKAALMLLQEAEIFHDPYFDMILGLEDHNPYDGSSSYKLNAQSESSLPSAISSPVVMKSGASSSSMINRSHKDVSSTLLNNSHHDSFSGSRQKRCRKLVDFLNYLTHIEVGSSLCVTLPSGAYFSFHLHSNLSQVLSNLGERVSLKKVSDEFFRVVGQHDDR